MQTSQTNKNQSSKLSKHKLSTPQAKLLEIERTFSVPVETLFSAFTSSEALKMWWWPKGMYADRIDFNFREGGEYFINMKGFDGGGGGMTGRFEEIIPNERIVMTDQFADANGRAISAAEAGMPGVWTDLIYITFEFESLGENSSRFHLSQNGIPNELQADCIQGWKESFNKLEKYLSGQTAM